MYLMKGLNPKGKKGVSYMDKIHQVSENSHFKQQTVSNKSKPGEFQSALATVLTAKGAKSHHTHQKMPLGEVAPVYPQPIELGQAEFLARTEQLIEMLDNYKSQLGNPERSLKDIAPLMNEIREKAGELITSSGDASQPDGALKKIVDNVALKASVEYIKYYRGDLL